MMPGTPVATYLPTLIKNYGFTVTISNLLTVPACIINLVISIIVARSADKRGNYAFHAMFGVCWTLAGFLALELLPGDAGRWNFYAAALFLASSPLWHGMHIAWMASNLAPFGKRTIALGAVIGAANICGVPGSQIYRKLAIAIIELPYCIDFFFLRISKQKLMMLLDSLEVIGSTLV